MSTLTHGHDNDTTMTSGKYNAAEESECQCWKRVQSCQETLSNIGTGLLWQVRERMVSIVFVPKPFLISFQFHLLFAGLLWTFCSATFGRCRLDRASYAYACSTKTTNCQTIMSREKKRKKVKVRKKRKIIVGTC